MKNKLINMKRSGLRITSKFWVFVAAFAMLSTFVSCGGDDPTDEPHLEVSPTILTVTETGEFKVKSNGDWEVTSSQGWCVVTPNKGSGDANVTVTVSEGGEGTAAVVTVKQTHLSATVTVTREIGDPNANPSVPVLTSGLTGGVAGISVFPAFEWSMSIDPDNDPVTYIVSYSKDGKTWRTSKTLTKCEYSMTEAPLDKMTEYSWKVTAKDNRGGESISEVGTFTTRNVGGYYHGEGRQILTHSKGSRGFRLVFTGDGFAAADYEDGGAFDAVIKEGVDGLFSFEPFATYKEYFDVYAVAAYSEERGISDKTLNVSKNTYFDVNYYEDPSMIIGADTRGDTKVYNHVKEALKINDASLKQSVIVVVANEIRYGGACYMPLDKRMLAVCAYSKDKLDPSGLLKGSYIHMIAHEVGGHAIGLLGEEYSSTGQEDESISGSDINNFREHVDVGYYNNVDLVSDRDKVKWKKYFGLKGYEAVGVFEGGETYGKGVWRAEELTCMDTNELYYSAPAREAIVKRIIEGTGGTFSFDEFIKNDKVKSLPPPVN